MNCDLFDVYVPRCTLSERGFLRLVDQMSSTPGTRFSLQVLPVVTVKATRRLNGEANSIQPSVHRFLLHMNLRRKNVLFSGVGEGSLLLLQRSRYSA